MCFPVNIAKMLRTPIYFEEHLRTSASEFVHTTYYSESFKNFLHYHYDVTHFQNISVK